MVPGTSRCPRRCSGFFARARHARTGNADAALRAPPFRDAPPYTFDASNRTPATPNTTARHASIARRPRTYSRRALSAENTSA